MLRLPLMSCTLCKLSCNNCFALRVWSAKETKSPSNFIFVPFRWHYQFYSFQMTKEYKSGAIKRAGARRWHLLKQFSFTYELGWLNEDSLPFAPAISRCHWQQFHPHLHQLEQKKNKELNFSRLLNNMITLQFISQEEKIGGGRGRGGLIEYILGRCGCGKFMEIKSLVEDAGFATTESFRFEDEDAI